MQRSRASRRASPKTGGAGAARSRRRSPAARRRPRTSGAARNPNGTVARSYYDEGEVVVTSATQLYYRQLGYARRVVSRNGPSFSQWPPIVTGKELYRRLETEPAPAKALAQIKNFATPGEA